MSVRIAETNNVKYDNVVFCLQKHPVKYNNIVFCLQQHSTNSITQLRNKINTLYGVYVLNGVSAPNQSLKAIADCSDDIQELDDITSSPSIVQYE